MIARGINKKRIGNALWILLIAVVGELLWLLALAISGRCR
jgi:hypothetical protein